MTEYKNVEFKEEATSDPKFQEYFDLAANNLHDFNSRTGLNVRLRYNEKEATFDRIADTPYNNIYDDYVFINWFITMYNNPQFVDDWIDNLYIERLENIFQKRRAVHNDREEATMFLKIFKNYHPIGFLSKENEEKLKSKLEEFNTVVYTYL